MATLLDTTYDCIEDDQSNWTVSAPVGCDGLTLGANLYPEGNTSFPTMITSAANYSGGGGGRGARHWYGDSDDSISGTLNFDFGSIETELWLRFYVRFQAGFDWNGGSHCKLLYMFTVGGDGTYCAPGFHNGFFGIQSSDDKDSTVQWDSIFSNTADWHALEYHIKTDTNGANGIAQGWVDGVERFNITNANWGTPTGWDGLRIGENHLPLANATGPIGNAIAWLDIDDLKIINSGGPIGPLSGGGGTVSGQRVVSFGGSQIAVRITS